MVRPQVQQKYVSAGLKSMIIKGIKVGSFFRVHLLYWCKQEERLKRRTGLVDRLLSKVILAYVTFYFAFASFRSIQAVMVHELELEAQIVSAFYTFYFLFLFLLSIGVTEIVDELPELINDGLALFEDFDRHLPLPKQQGRIGLPILWITEQFQRTFYFSAHFLCVATCAVCVVKADLPVLVSSLWDPSSGHYTTVVVLTTLMQFFYHIFYVSITYFLINTGTGIAFPLVPALDMLASKRMDTKRQVTENIRYHTKIRLLVDKMERIFLTYIIPVTQNILTVLSTFGIVGAIRFGGSVGAVLTLCGLITYGCLVTIFGVLAKVHSGGEQLLDGWKRNHAIDQRSIRCLKPIRMKLGFYAFINKQLLLTATNIILNYAIALLLA